MNRKIIHLDMDAFFAAIEERDNPSLRGKPVIVGSPPDSRGVVSTCNYEARKYGIHSAMSSAEAYRRCPHAIFVESHFAKYHEASQQVHAIMEAYTDCIEFLSLDEGYMDVTESERFLGSAEEIAKTIQAKVYETVKTTCSVGVGYNMLSAKLASEEKKPCGFFVIPNPESFYALMKDRPVESLYGIGEKTAGRLERMGIHTVGELAEADPMLLSAFGQMAEEMQNRARGIDLRSVQPNAPAKSIGRETTFPTNVTDRSILEETLLLLSRGVSERAKGQKFSGHTLTLKVKYGDMQSISRSQSKRIYDRPDLIYQGALELLESVDLSRPVRLLGVAVSHPDRETYEQLSFESVEEQGETKEKALDSIVTDLRNAYGKNMIKTAKELLAERHLYSDFSQNEEES